MQPLKELISLLSQDKVIPVIGAGVSYEVAGLPGWSDTVLHGLEFASLRYLFNSPEQLEEAKLFLSKGQITDAANVMKEVLNAPSHPFTEWLNELFGDPAITSTRLLNAINDLEAPIVLTTNYDPLLYSTNKLHQKKVFSWMDYEQIKRAQINSDEFYLHLHGIYNRPESIILCSEDYEKLAEQGGYKDILKSLWCNYHFLFIGCSHNGILDEDFSTVFNFLNEWFPGVPNTHFALLLEADIEKGVPTELMRKANVTTINYGKQHCDLVSFIEHINPNKEKALRKLEEMKTFLDKEFNRRASLEPQTKDAIPSEIGSFLQENLSKQSSSLNSRQFEEIKKIFDEYNRSIKSKRQTFANYLRFVQGMINLNDLNSKIDYWQQNRDKPSNLSNYSFINTAVVAYRCLQAFPEDLLEDIRHREPYAIHDYYFTGYLGSFINEYTTQRQLSGDGVYASFEDDEYFFENLKRIVDSLKCVMALNPNDVFNEVLPAQINKSEQYELLFTSKNTIELRKGAHPYQLIAQLHSDENLPFIGAEHIKYKGEQLIVGNTSQASFYWNPRNDYYYHIFFSAPKGAAISKIVNIRGEDELTSYIFCGGYWYTFWDFVQTSKIKIGQDFYNWTYLQTLNKVFTLRNSATTNFGTILFEIQADGNTIPLFSKSELWNVMESFYEVKIDFELYRKSYINYPHFQNIQLVKAYWKRKEVLLMRAMLHLSKRYSVFIFFDYSDQKVTVLTRICIPETLCLAYDVYDHGNGVDMAFGYASTGNHFRLVKHLRDIDQKNHWMILEKGEVIDARVTTPEDIYDISYISRDRIFALQQGNNVYDINLSDYTYTESEYAGLRFVTNIELGTGKK